MINFYVNAANQFSAFSISFFCLLRWNFSFYLINRLTRYIVHCIALIRRMGRQAGQIHSNNFCGAGIATDGIRGDATKKAGIKKPAYNKKLIVSRFSLKIPPAAVSAASRISLPQPERSPAGATDL